MLPSWFEASKDISVHINPLILNLLMRLTIVKVCLLVIMQLKALLLCFLILKCVLVRRVVMLILKILSIPWGTKIACVSFTLLQSIHRLRIAQRVLFQEHVIIVLIGWNSLLRQFFRSLLFTALLRLCPFTCFMIAFWAWNYIFANWTNLEIRVILCNHRVIVAILSHDF